MADMLEVDIHGRAGRFSITARFGAAVGVTALFGRSGAGKSTILKMIAGTAKPRSGRIVAGGRVLFDAASGVDVAARKRGVGFVFQEGRLFPHLTVRRNLTYARWAGRRLAGQPLDEVVALLGLERHLDRYPETLSGGERQRVAIGRALLSEPQILLMDEPLSSLDRPRRVEILPYLQRIANETRIPLIYVSHETEEVSQLADQVVLVENGEAIRSGAPAEMIGQVSGEAEGPVSILEGHVRQLDKRFGTARISLGDVFIELPADGLSLGARVRLCVRAADVAIATRAHNGLSIRNQLLSKVIAVDFSRTRADIVLSVGGQRLAARITAQSAAELGISEGQSVFALIKAVSVERARLLHHL